MNGISSFSVRTIFNPESSRGITVYCSETIVYLFYRFYIEVIELNMN